MKLSFGLTKAEYPYFILFVIASITTLALVIHFNYYHDYVERTITLISYGVSMLILGLFWLDEKDIITFRARKDRLTKCNICNRTYENSQSIIDEDDIEPEEQTIVEQSGDVEQKTVSSKIKPKKARPVNGLVVNGKLVCDQCLDVIKEIYKKWR